MSRADRLVALLEERSLDWLLVTNLVNVRYLTGFTGTNGACLVSPDERLFFTDFRYVERARAEVRDFERVEGGRDLLGDLAARLRGRSGFDDAHLSVRAHRRLAEKAGEGVELVPAGGLVERLREQKDEGELRSMRAAAQMADVARFFVDNPDLRPYFFGGKALPASRDIRRRYATRGAPCHPRPFQPDPHESRHAAQGHPAASHAAHQLAGRG